MKTIKGLLRLSRPGLAAFAFWLIISTLAWAIVQVALSLQLKFMFDALALQNPKMLLDTVVLGFAVICAFAIVGSVSSYFRQRSVAKVSAGIRESVFAHLQSLPLTFYKARHSGDLISRLTNDMVEAERSYAHFPGRLLGALMSGLASIVLLFVFDWRLGLWALAVGAASFYLNSHFAQKLRTISVAVQEDLGRVTEVQTDILAGVSVIRSFNLRTIMSQKFNALSNSVKAKSLLRVEQQSIITALNSGVQGVSFIGTLFLATYLSVQGAVTVGTLIASMQMLGVIRHMFSVINSTITGIQPSLAAGDRLLEIIDAQPEPLSYQVEGVSDSTEGVEFSNVSFAFADSEPVLNGLSLAVEKGQVVALAGPSGGGKSTILRVILGLLEPQGGQISIAGKALSEQTLETLRQQIAFVPQDPYMFSGSIFENISYGRSDASDDDGEGEGDSEGHSEVVAAAKAANAHDFIMKMEKGYDTPVGERGAQLSGGQRQRIAIARALLKDAPILLLDEATSALDSESEHLVQEALEILMQGRTTIVVAHRLSTIKGADKILVVAGGSIVEQGTHAELLKREDGVYRSLYEQQFFVAAN